MNKGFVYYFYEGQQILLRATQKEDYTQGMFQWANDPEFNRFLSHGLRATTQPMMEKLYEDLLKKENYIFAILDKKTQKLVGLIGLHQPNWQIRSMEYAIHIGDKNFWGKGVAGEATDFILNYAFNTLNLHKVWLGVAEPNNRAVDFYKKKGFVLEGRLRHEIFRENRYFDSLRMSLLKEEYQKQGTWK